MKKYVIWDNINLDIDDWRDGYREFCEINDIEYDENDENAVYNYMIETNAEYFHDERDNLNCYVDGDIVVFADLGLWNGRRAGVRVYPGGHVNDILRSDCDFMEWYGDGRNIRATGHHHDGTNHYLYRIARPGRNIEKLLDDIRDGRPISAAKIAYYTRSLFPAVAVIYGWRPATV